MLTEAQNLAVTRTELDSVFFQKYDYKNPVPGIADATTASIFKPLTTTHSAYIEEVFGGTGLFNNIGETSTVPVAVPKYTNKLTTPVLDWAQSIPLSKNFFDDNMHGAWQKAVENMAYMARKTQDNYAMSWFRNAFTTSLTADGYAFIGSTHPLIQGGNQSNLITGALSPTTFKNAVVALGEQKGQNGVVMGHLPKILLVPYALFEKAKQYTNSALQPDVANNNYNVWRGEYSIEVYTSPYLGATAGGSDTAWFLLGEFHSVTRLIRQGIETALTPWQYSNNRTYNYQANFRETVYAPNWEGAVGSAG